MSSNDDDKDSVFSLYGSRESLATASGFPRSKRPSLKLKIAHGCDKSAPNSPRIDRKFEPQLPRTPIKETASQLYRKSFSDLHKGLDSIFQSKSRPPSRASNFGEAPREMTRKDNDSGYLTVQNSTDVPDGGEGRVNPAKPLIKSLSRKSLYDEDHVKVDDCDVYHTITGGRTHSIAATRSINPFSKITRRPLHKVLANKVLHPKINDCEADLDTESVISLGDDSWRLVRHLCHARMNKSGNIITVQEYIILSHPFVPRPYLTQTQLAA